ncbi:hypothetical protein BKA83DRAFT_4184706, partial [Pisolithus microcarpus]
TNEPLRTSVWGWSFRPYLSLVLRLLLRRDSLPPSKGSLLIYVLTYLPALFLSRYLESIGTSRRDPTTGALISSGEDLNQPGVTEWSFDVLYVTWACQVGSGAFGEWFWYFYLVIPLYALFKVWTGLVGPFLWPSSGRSTDGRCKEGRDSRVNDKKSSANAVNEEIRGFVPARR